MLQHAQAQCEAADCQWMTPQLQQPQLQLDTDAPAARYQPGSAGMQMFIGHSCLGAEVAFPVAARRN